MTSAVIVVSYPVAYQRFCGRTLVERHQRHLRDAGVADVHIVTPSEFDRYRHDREPHDRILVVTAERLFDPRLYAAALAREGPLHIVDGGDDLGLELVRGAGRGSREVAPALSAGERPQPRGTAIDLQSLDPYSRELRRPLRPYWMRVGAVADGPAVTRLLVDASGKGHQDLPAMLLNAPLEKLAMRWLANTRVTPNHITLACNLLAYAVAALMATGHLLAGAVGALVVGVVDGLDGRQARIQLRTTALGRLEHVLDKGYEVAWIVALAYTLSGGFVHGRYGAALCTWVTAYLFDTAAYELAKRSTGVTLDEVSPADAAIRLVAGRRNVYACLLLVGVLAGQAGAAFGAIVWWAVITAIVHGIRAAMVIRSSRRRVLV